MKVIVVHEDGDRSSRVADLLKEVRQCVDQGTLRYQNVSVSLEVHGTQIVTIPKERYDQLVETERMYQLHGGRD